MTESQESEDLHTLKNHLSVIIVLAELLMTDLPESEPLRDDIAAIHQASLDAMTVVRRLRGQPESS
jgi:hypothetical protein